MLPKRRRITRHEFPSDPRVGKVFHTEHLSLRATPSKNSQPRVSVVVSKKSAKRAVDRHLVKRRVYDSVGDISVLPWASYVFFAKTGAHTLPYRALHDEVTKLLNEAKQSIVKSVRLV